MLITLGYIGAIVILIAAVAITRSYMNKNRKIFVDGAPPQAQKRSFISNHAALFLLVITPILFGLAWFIGWIYSWY